MKQGLIIIDVQNDYFNGGAMELAGMDGAASHCKKLLELFRDRQAPIFHIQHIAAGEGSTFFIPGTKGCEIHESVTPLDGEPLVTKNYPSAFRETGLQDMLNRSGIEDIVICGAMTHMCIDTSTRAAFDLGYNCCVISDACATRNLVFDGHEITAVDVHAAFMSALSTPFAKVLSTEKFLKVE